MDRLTINIKTGETIREPFEYTPEEITANELLLEQERVRLIRQEAKRRKIALIPDFGEEFYEIQRDQKLMRASVLMRKEMKGTATVEEIQELNALETLSTQIEDINAAEAEAITLGTAPEDVIWP